MYGVIIYHNYPFHYASPAVLSQLTTQSIESIQSIQYTFILLVELHKLLSNGEIPLLGVRRGVARRSREIAPTCSKRTTWQLHPRQILAFGLFTGMRDACNASRSFPAYLLSVLARILFSQNFELEKGIKGVKARVAVVNFERIFRITVDKRVHNRSNPSLRHTPTGIPAKHSLFRPSHSLFP